MASGQSSVFTAESRVTAGSVAISSSNESIEGPSSNQMETLLTRHSFAQELDKTRGQMKKEEHAKRLKGLRRELDYLSVTQWQFKPIDKLIGQGQ